MRTADITIALLLIASGCGAREGPLGPARAPRDADTDATNTSDGAGADSTATDIHPADAGTVRPPDDAGSMAPSEPCAEGIRHVWIDMPPRSFRDAPRTPRIIGVADQALVLDVDQPARGGVILGRVALVDARAGALEWSTDVELPLSAFANPPVPIGARRVAGGWEAAWVQPLGGWLGVTVRFDDDGRVMEVVPIDDAAGHSVVTIYSATDDDDGYWLTARSPSDDTVLIRIRDGRAEAIPTALFHPIAGLRLDVAERGPLARAGSAGVVGAFRQLVGDDVFRLTTVRIADSTFEEPLSNVPLEDTTHADLDRVVVSGDLAGAVVAASYYAPPRIVLHWLDGALRESARSTFPISGAAYPFFVGVASTASARAVAMVRFEAGTDLLFGLVRDVGDIEGALRPVISVPDSGFPYTAALWSTPTTFHLGWWRGDLEILSFACGATP
ncbi:MAG: hypothetical protein IT379_26645 [Deltaproteobacteria bacterium]|nr:hypothetical protein [Deltaproteobacteria bacterium]